MVTRQYTSHKYTNTLSHRLGRRHFMQAFPTRRTGITMGKTKFSKTPNPHNKTEMCLSVHSGNPTKCVWYAKWMIVKITTAQKLKIQHKSLLYQNDNSNKQPPHPHPPQPKNKQKRERETQRETEREEVLVFVS